MTEYREPTPRTPAQVGRPSAEVIAIARQSCQDVVQRPVLLAERFYSHLFDLAPATRPMFPPDMTGQHEKMSRALTYAVDWAAADPAKIERAMRQMGAAHARLYDVQAEHYPYVGRALHHAVRDVAHRWDSSIGSAWIQVYEWLAAHMVAGSTEVPASRPQPHPATRRRPATPPRTEAPGGRHSAP